MNKLIAIFLCSLFALSLQAQDPGTKERNRLNYRPGSGVTNNAKSTMDANKKKKAMAELDQLLENGRISRKSYYQRVRAVLYGKGDVTIGAYKRAPETNRGNVQYAKNGKASFSDQGEAKRALQQKMRAGKIDNQDYRERLQRVNAGDLDAAVVGNPQNEDELYDAKQALMRKLKEGKISEEDYETETAQLDYVASQFENNDDAEIHVTNSIGTWTLIAAPFEAEQHAHSHEKYDQGSKDDRGALINSDLSPTFDVWETLPASVDERRYVLTSSTTSFGINPKQAATMEELDRQRAEGTLTDNEYEEKVSELFEGVKTEAEKNKELLSDLNHVAKKNGFKYETLSKLRAALLGYATDSHEVVQAYKAFLKGDMNKEELEYIVDRAEVIGS